MAVFAELEKRHKAAMSALKRKVVLEVAFYFGSHRKPMRQIDLFHCVRRLLRRAGNPDFGLLLLDMRKENLIKLLVNDLGQKKVLPINYEEINSLTQREDT